MSTDAYIRMSCPNCESSYAVDFMVDSVDGTPEHCPFCGEQFSDYEDKNEETEEEDEGGEW